MTMFQDAIETLSRLEEAIKMALDADEQNAVSDAYRHLCGECDEDCDYCIEGEGGEGR